MKNIVKKSIKEIFKNDNSLNNGTYKDKCDTTLKEYYIALSKNKKYAKNKCKMLLKAFLKDKTF